MTYEPRQRVVRAKVVAAGVTTEYLCAGSGRPLLILARESRRGELIDAVPAGYRVLAPLVGEAVHAIDADGLNELVDGLGLSDVLVVADMAFAALASMAADSFPFRFAAVLIVDSGTIDLTGALASLGP